MISDQSLLLSTIVLNDNDNINVVLFPVIDFINTIISTPITIIDELKIYFNGYYSVTRYISIRCCEGIDGIKYQGVISPRIHK